MITVTLDELELNAVLASLDDRVQRMSHRLVSLTGQPESESRDFAVDATREAIRHAMRAQLDIAAALPDAEHPPEMTVTDLDDERYDGCPSCGADTYSRHWVYCPNFPRPVLAGIEQYQAEGR